MLQSRAGRDKSVGQMDIFLKVKNWRWVSKFAVSVMFEVDDDPVLLEEVADREAEARVDDTILLGRWWCLGHGEKVAGGFRVW
jgi:hypothetical protein